MTTPSYTILSYRTLTDKLFRAPAAPAAAAAVAAAVVFTSLLSPIVSDGPTVMQGLHIAVSCVAPTGRVGTQLGFSLTCATCSTECSVPPTVAAPQPEAPSSVHTTG